MQHPDCIDEASQAVARLVGEKSRLRISPNAAELSDQGEACIAKASRGGMIPNDGGQ